MSNNNSDYPIYMHVNYLENTFPIEEIIARCAKAGYDGIELRGYDLEDKITPLEYVNLTRKITTQHGLEVTYGCPNNTITTDPAERKKSMDTFKGIIDFASSNGVKVLNIFGSNIVNPELRYIDFDGNGSGFVTDEQWKSTVEYFQEAGDFAEGKGVDLCFETHNCYMHDLGKPTAELLAEINRPCIKANLDFGNIYINKLNQGMDAELKALDGRIGYLHLKNLISLLPSFEMAVYKSTSLEDGDINNFVMVRQLIKNGYKGIITIENTISGDKRNFMSKDLEYLKTLLADVLQGL